MGGFGSKIVESPQRKMQLITLKKSGLGTPAISGSCANFCTITDNGTGDYTINLTEIPLAQVPEVFVQVKTDNRIAKLGTVTALAVRVLTEDLSGDAAEADFDLLIVGSLARDLIG